MRAFRELNARCQEIDENFSMSFKIFEQTYPSKQQSTGQLEYAIIKPKL